MIFVPDFRFLHRGEDRGPTVESLMLNRRGSNRTTRLLLCSFKESFPEDVLEHFSRCREGKGVNKAERFRYFVPRNLRPHMSLKIFGLRCDRTFGNNYRMHPFAPAIIGKRDHSYA